MAPVPQPHPSPTAQASSSKPVLAPQVAQARCKDHRGRQRRPGCNVAPHGPRASQLNKQEHGEEAQGGPKQQLAQLGHAQGQGAHHDATRRGSNEGMRVIHGQLPVNGERRTCFKVNRHKGAEHTQPLDAALCEMPCTAAPMCVYVCVCAYVRVSGFYAPCDYAPHHGPNKEAQQTDAQLQDALAKEAHQQAQADPAGRNEQPKPRLQGV